jgi:hypothetical protein
MIPIRQNPPAAGARGPPEADGPGDLIRTDATRGQLHSHIKGWPRVEIA